MLDYGHFEAKEGGVEVDDSTHFAQKYSLTVEKNGRFWNGRGGRYKLLLGGEWAGLDSEVTLNSVTTDLKVERSKFLYAGDVTFAPGGLPFYLHLFSRDLDKIRFETDYNFHNEGSFGFDTLTRLRRTVLDPQIIDDMSDGQHVYSGASMVIGIRNGSYLGKYRNVLSNFPKLFFDYSELYVKDTKTFTPQHYRDRELAFVSLNKKHNWFHYRFFDHYDKLNPQNNYYERILTLGTIDERLKREWVNLTNWIQLSVDGNYLTKIDEKNAAVDGKKNEYLLNLFTKTSRKNWHSSMYSRYRRKETLLELERNLRVPIYAWGDLDRDASWRTRWVVDRSLENKPFALINQEIAEDDYFTATRFDLRKTGDYKISPLLEIESKSGDRGNGEAFRTGVELASSKKSKADFDLYSSLEMSYFNIDQDNFVPDAVDFFETQVDVNYSKNLTGRTKAGFESSLLYGNGELSTTVTDHILPRSYSGFEISDNRTFKIQDDVYRTDLVAFFEHLSMNRISNRFEAGVNYRSTDGEGESQSFLLHRLEYSTSTLTARTLSELVLGDLINSGAKSSVLDVTLVSSTFKGTSFSNISDFRYKPNRKWYLTGKFTFDMRDVDSKAEGGYHLGLNQETRYTLYSKAGRLRRLVDLSEIFEYEYWDLESGGSPELAMLMLQGRYFPTSWAVLGSRFRMQHNFEAGNDETGVGVYANFNFSKLNVEMEYEVGMRSEDDLGNVLDRDEQRWQISLTKTF